MLYQLQQQAEENPDLQIAGLFTTINQAFDRVAMHAVRRELLQAQAEAAGLPMHVIRIPWPCSNEAYEAAMKDFVDQARAQGITHFAFGDLFLEDIRSYREEKLQGSGIEPMFPIWGQDTRELSRHMIDSGLEAIVTCVDPKQLDNRFCGQRYDAQFLAELPAGTDPCGENGEFHSFAFAGPMFAYKVLCTVSETLERDGFVYTDLLPDKKAS